MVEISRSLQLCMSFPPHIGKKNFFSPPSGTGVIRKCLCVCASVRLSVCPSVHLSICPSVRLSICPSVRLWPQKSTITFERDVGSTRNFLQRPHSRRVIFGRVTRTPGLNGSGPDPGKRGIREIYLPRGFRAGGDMSYHFGN